MSGFEIDPAHPWRSMALAGIPVRAASIALPTRARSVVAPDNDIAATPMNVALWLDAMENSPNTIPIPTAMQSAHSGEVEMVYEIGDAREQGASCGVDDGEARMVRLPYDLVSKDTVVTHSHAEAHMAVKPKLNEPALQALRSAQTVDGFAKVVGAKLARATATVDSMPDPLSGMTLSKAAGGGDIMATALEGLRLAMERESAQADYGWRLWSMANVVCHAQTLAILGEDPAATDTMYLEPPQQSVLTAKLLYLRAAQIRENSWWHVGDEQRAEYRALMIMAGRGLQNYVAKGQETVYSRAACEPEVKDSDTMVFTALTGDERLAPPNAGHYLHVLANPNSALAMYYDYARSVGVGNMATLVLLQAAHGPHVWASNALLPYYPVSPKLDAMTSLLQVSSAVCLCG